MYQLRAATEGDVEAIATIWHRGWFDGHLGHVPDSLYEHRRFDDFRTRVPARLDATTVASDGEQVVGFVVVHADEVEQIYVAPPARGSGVASELLGHAETVIGACHDRAWLAVVAGNDRARRFYARHGWHDSGAFDYPAEAGDTTLTVPVQRYEKAVQR